MLTFGETQRAAAAQQLWIDILCLRSYWIMKVVCKCTTDSFTGKSQPSFMAAGYAVTFSPKHFKQSFGAEQVSSQFEWVKGLAAGASVLCSSSLASALVIIITDPDKVLFSFWSSQVWYEADTERLSQRCLR